MSVESALPPLFLVLASAAVGALILSVWQSLRAALGVGVVQRRALGESATDHGSLRDEKAALLRSIKDLEFERAVGKISDADFERMNASFRERAKTILAVLDADLEPFRAQAERLLAAAPSDAGSSPDARITDDIKCSNCDINNDSDAQFCKKCGTPLRQIPRQEAAS